VEVDGTPVARVPVDAGRPGLTLVDLARAARPGSHRVALSFAGEGEIDYQLVAAHHRPWSDQDRSTLPAPAAAGLEVRTRLQGPSRVQVGDTLLAEVELTSHLDEPVDMPLVQAGLPPGFDVDVEALDRLVADGKVAKFERGVREVTFYLLKLPARATVRLPVRLWARLPGEVQLPAPLAYEYYRPERRALGRPLRVASRLPAPARGASPRLAQR
jgi:hypothetical protein